MLRRAKEAPDSEVILIFDVRDKAIALNTNREPKVYLGRITPLKGVRTMFKWESRWGGNQGLLPTIDMCEQMIAKMAKGQYR